MSILEDHESLKQVEAALDAGDEELEQDLEQHLAAAFAEVERGRGVGYHSQELEPYDFISAFDPEDVITYSDRLSSLSREMQAEAKQQMVDALEYDLSLRLQTGRGRNRYFEVNNGRSDLSWNVPYTVSVGVSPDEVFDYPDLIPPEYAERFWAGIEPFFDLLDGWQEPTDNVVEYNYGEQDKPATLDLYNADEFCRDILQDLVSNMNEDEVLVFFEETLMSHFSRKELELLFKKINKEELVDFANAYFIDDEPDEVLEILKDYVTGLSAPKGLLGDREVILKISPETIARLGIRKGIIKEEAPWYLLKLEPNDLSIEGVLMNHCVGQYKMGYREAVQRGEIEIWSLRDRNGKPRFTLQVDSRFNYTEDPDEKAEAISQLKGKGNRTPGYAQSRSSSLKFPEEVELWDYIFSELGINPSKVSDFPAFRYVAEQPELRANPRRRMRSFDEPYRPLRRF